MRWPVSDWPELPYPGLRPPGSWRLSRGCVDSLDGDVSPKPSHWRDVNLEDLVWVLAYGSNANPAKLHRKGLDDVVMLDATITDARAVWCRARRMAGDVVATLVRSPGHVESCPVLGLNPTQLGAVDLWEGHPVRYRREPFWGVCTVRTGLTLSPHVYVGTAIRPPLLLNGEMVGLHDLPYCDVDLMVETTALSTTD